MRTHENLIQSLRKGPNELVNYKSSPRLEKQLVTMFNQNQKVVEARSQIQSQTQKSSTKIH
jgi:hypothetical protein